MVWSPSDVTKERPPGLIGSGLAALPHQVHAAPAGGAPASVDSPLTLDQGPCPALAWRIGACVAGHPGYAPPQKMSDQLATDAYSLWSMDLSTGASGNVLWLSGLLRAKPGLPGETAYFTVTDIDQVSDDSCAELSRNPLAASPATSWRVLRLHHGMSLPGGV